MATITELKAKIANDLTRSDLTTQIDEAIQEAVDFYHPEVLWFQEDRASNTTSIGEPLYPLPEDYLSLDSFYITVNSSKYPLNQLGMHEFEEKYTDTEEQGEPCDFCIYDQQLKLGPTPSEEWPITLHYIRFIDAPASGENNYTSRLVKQLISARAKHIIYADTIKDSAQASVQGAREMQILAQIRKKNTLHHSQTRVRKCL